MAKIYASYGTQEYRPLFVTTSKKSLLDFLGNIQIHDIRIYHHLTMQQVKLLTISQAIFLESVMEENIKCQTM